VTTIRWWRDLCVILAYTIVFHWLLWIILVPLMTFELFQAVLTVVYVFWFMLIVGVYSMARLHGMEECNQRMEMQRQYYEDEEEAAT
jgi:hypothetical protein